MAKRIVSENDAPTENRRVVYLGPNIAKGLLTTGSVFKGGLPAHVERLIEKCSEIRLLIVPVDRVVDAKKAVETPGTEEHRLCQIIADARIREV